jgi:tetratricopeptide (TPR) repeat protein
MLFVLVFDFLGSGVIHSFSLVVPSVIIVSTWLIGGLVESSPYDVESRSRGARFSVSARRLIASFVCVAVYGLLQACWLPRSLPDHWDPGGFLGAIPRLQSITVLLWCAVLLVAASPLWSARRRLSNVNLRSTRVLVSWVVGGLTIWHTSVSPARANVTSGLSEVYERNRRWEMAIALQRAAVALQPSEDQLLVKLARIHIARSADEEDKEEAVSEAQRTLERALQIRPCDGSHHHNLANVHWSWMRTAEDNAVRREQARLTGEAYSQALEFQPRNPFLWNERAAFLMDSGRPEQALASLQHSLSLDPRNLSTFEALGAFYLSRGDWTSAQRTYAAGLSIRETVGLLRGRASAEAQLGNAELAIRLFTKVLRREPNDPVSRHNLEVLLGSDGRGRTAAGPGTFLQASDSSTVVASDGSRAATQ